MKPKPTICGTLELFQANFEQILNLNHELCQLAPAISWDRFDTEFADCYSEDMGRPGTAIRRKGEVIDDERETFLGRADRLLSQRRDSKNKLYRIDAAEVECVRKGKAHKRYEFGCKVSVATTNMGPWVVGVEALAGNPYDGHTLADTVSQSERLTDRQVKDIFVHLGYKGHNYGGEAEVHITGRRCIIRFFQGRLFIAVSKKQYCSNRPC